MRRLLLAAASAALVSATSVDAAPWLAQRAVDDATLAAVVGKAGATTRLSLFVAEQGDTFGQLTSEDLRVTLANWFVDGNIQNVANDVLRNG